MAIFRIAVIGDMHFGFDERSTLTAAAALADTALVEPDVLLLTGDLVDAQANQWGAFREALRSAAKAPLLAVRGNADLAAGGDEAWRENLGRDARATLDVGGFRFLTLGAEGIDHEMEVGEDAGEWLRGRAAERPEADVIVLSHAPLRDTTFWSCMNAEDGCLADVLPPDNPPYHLFIRRSEALQQSLASAPNVRMFITGHVHHDGRLVCKHGYGAYAIRSGVIHLVTGNVGGWIGLGGERREYHVIEVDEDTVKIRSRDFTTRSWVEEMELRFPRWPANQGS